MPREGFAANLITGSGLESQLFFLRYTDNLISVPGFTGIIFLLLYSGVLSEDGVSFSDIFVILS